MNRVRSQGCDTLNTYVDGKGDHQFEIQFLLFRERIKMLRV